MTKRASLFPPMALPLTVLTLLSLAGGARAYDVSLRYPSEVALSQEGDKGYVFRRFPGSQRLYTYDRDDRSHSACNVGCDGAHTPGLAPDDDKPMDAK